ncbi:hypothetical protein ACFQNE_13980 [Gordonia phosphorivorans]|uniref:Integral membrane protein n=1 Tax=Gordonia phosphorivorans TaxID=1056982 RepID=A0ABV6HCR8_9ACTN
MIDREVAAMAGVVVTLARKSWRAVVDIVARVWGSFSRHRHWWKVAGLVLVAALLGAFVDALSDPKEDYELLTWVGVIFGLSALFAFVGPALLAWILFGVLGDGIRPTAALTRLGAAAGAGTAAGLLVSVITFYFAWLNNAESAGLTNDEVSEFSGYDPGLFLTLPALGAIIGFSAGLVAVVVDAAARSRWPRPAIRLSPVVLPLIVLATSPFIGPAHSMRALIDMLLVNDPEPDEGSWLSKIAEEQNTLIDSALPVPVLVVVTAAVTGCYALAAWRRTPELQEVVPR